MLKSTDSKPRGICVYAAKSNELGIAYRIDIDVLRYLVREKKLGNLTISEFNEVAMPRLLIKGDESMQIIPFINKYFIGYNPIEPRINRLEMMLNNPKTIKNSC
jgi:hypothetical protein